MNPEDTLTIRQLHADGACYRRYHAIKEPGLPAVVLDEDAFAEAIVTYGYSEQHQQKCWATVRAGLVLAETWQPRGWQPA